MLGIALIGLGLILAGAARRRAEVERMLWPDER